MGSQAGSVCGCQAWKQGGSSRMTLPSALVVYAASWAAVSAALMGPSTLAPLTGAALPSSLPSPGGRHPTMINTAHTEAPAPKGCREGIEAGQQVETLYSIREAPVRVAVSAGRPCWPVSTEVAVGGSAC